MTSVPRRSLWVRVYAISTWTLIVYFGLLAIVHVVLTALFYLGVRDTGVGFILDFELPAWLITVLDGSAAYLLWTGYRRGVSDPVFGLVVTIIASVIMLGRALWFVLVPVLVVVTISGSVAQVIRSNREPSPDPRIDFSR